MSLFLESSILLSPSRLGKVPGFLHCFIILENEAIPCTIILFSNVVFQDRLSWGLTLIVMTRT